MAGYIKQEHNAADDAYDDNILLSNNVDENEQYFQYDDNEEHDGLIEYVEEEDEEDAIEEEEQIDTHTLSIRKLNINGAYQQQVYRCLECAINFATVEDFTKVHREMQKKKQQHKNKDGTKRHITNVESGISYERNALVKEEQEEQGWAIVKEETANEQIASGVYDDNADTEEYIGISNADEAKNDDMENEVAEFVAEADPFVEHQVVIQHDNDNEEDDDDVGEKYFCCDCQLIFGNLESAEQHVCSALSRNKNISADENEVEKEEYVINNMHVMNQGEEQKQKQQQQQEQEEEEASCGNSSNKVEPKASVAKYPCVQCDKKFSTLHGLHVHMRSHSSKTTKANAEKIVETANAANPTCPICNTTFSTIKNLKLHLKIHNAQQVRSIEQALPAGAKAQYTDMNKFFCEICNKSFEQNLLGIHKNMHQQKQDLNCGICNRHFDNKTSYEMHMQMHADRPIKPRKSQKKAHNEDGSSDKEHGNGRFACQYCGRTFQRPFEKVRHERVHTGEKPYACEVCGKTFRVPYSLTLHLRTHTDIRPYVCATCNKRFKSQTVYAHHLRTHEAERAYKCEICSKAFRTSVQLSAHRNIHRKPYSCPICSRPFASLYYVKVHMKTHNKTTRTGDTTKYSCYVCGAVYARISALRIHMKELHLIDMDTNEPLQLDADEMIKQGKYTLSRQRDMAADEEVEEDEEEEDVEDDVQMVDNEDDDEPNEVDQEAAILIAAAAEADCAAYIEAQANADAATESAGYEVIFPTDELIVDNYQTEEVVTDWLAK